MEAGAGGAHDRGSDDWIPEGMGWMRTKPETGAERCRENMARVVCGIDGMHCIQRLVQLVRVNVEPDAFLIMMGRGFRFAQTARLVQKGAGKIGLVRVVYGGRGLAG